MRRRALVLAVVVALLAAAGPGAADTGVTGHVDSMVELSLQRSAPDRVAATVTATVAPTHLSADGDDLKTYTKPVAHGRTTVRAQDGATELTITYGPQGP